MVNVVIVDNRAEMEILDLVKAAAELFVQNSVKFSPVTLFELGDERGGLLNYISDNIENLEDSIKTITAGSGFGNFSFTISNAITMANKVRIRNGTDRFGYGRAPWVIEPMNIFIFTHNVGVWREKDAYLKRHEQDSNKAVISLLKTPGTGGEMVEERPFRWDHKIFFVILDHVSMIPKRFPIVEFDVNQYKSDNEEPTTGNEGWEKQSWHKKAVEEMRNLCESTGGDLVQFSGSMGDLTSFIPSLVERTTQMSVTVSMCVLDFDISAGGLEAQKEKILANLVVKGPGEWPLPESFWVTTSESKLGVRAVHPTLSLYNKVTHRDEIDIAIALSVPIDTYEVFPIQTNSKRVSSLHHQLGLKKRGEYCPIIIRGSGRLPNKNDSSGFCSVPGNDRPFAVLRAGNSSTSVEVLVLPYNYPVLLPLLKRLKENVTSGLGNDDLSASSFTTSELVELFKQPWTQKWREDISNYMSSVPPYLVASVIKLLKRSCAYALASSVMPNEFKLHPSISKEMSIFQENAKNDVLSMERVALAKRTMSRNFFRPAATDIAAHEYACGQLAYWEIPQSISVSPSLPSLTLGSLLSTWERMRRAVYGAGQGHTVRGLSLHGVAGTGGGSAKHAFDDDWVGRALVEGDGRVEGAGCAPQLSIRDMSRYMDVLCRREALRDAQDETPAADEDTPYGLLRRKLNVNFGNRYRHRVATGSNSTAGKPDPDLPITFSSPSSSSSSLADHVSSIDRNGGGSVSKILLSAGELSRGLANTTNDPSPAISGVSHVVEALSLPSFNVLIGSDPSVPALSSSFPHSEIGRGVGVRTDIGAVDGDFRRELLLDVNEELHNMFADTPAPHRDVERYQYGASPDSHDDHASFGSNNRHSSVGNKVVDRSETYGARKRARSEDEDGEVAAAASSKRGIAFRHSPESWGDTEKIPVHTDICVLPPLGRPRIRRTYPPHSTSSSLLSSHGERRQRQPVSSHSAAGLQGTKTALGGSLTESGSAQAPRKREEGMLSATPELSYSSSSSSNNNNKVDHLGDSVIKDAGSFSSSSSPRSVDFTPSPLHSNPSSSSDATASNTPADQRVTENKATSSAGSARTEVEEASHAEKERVRIMPAVAVSSSSSSSSSTTRTSQKDALHTVPASVPSSNATGRATIAAPVVGGSWEKHFSKKHNRNYWFQPSTGKNSWDEPRE